MIEPIPFFTYERLTEFWHNVQILLLLAVPMLVIFLGTYFGGQIIYVIREVFSRFFGKSDEDYEDY